MKTERKIIPLKSLVDGHPSPMIMVDEGGNVLHVNAVARKWLGDRSVAEVIARLDAEAESRQNDRSACSRGPRSKRLDGAQVDSFTVDEREFRLITLSNRAEEPEPCRTPWEHSRTDWQSLVDVLQEAVFVTDEKMLVTHANRAACELVGRDRGEIVGKSLYTMIHGRNRCPDYLRFLERRVGFECRVQQIEEPYLNRFLELTVSRLECSVGDCVRYILVVNDLTTKRRHEQEAHRLNTALAKSFRGITQALSDLVESRDPYTAGHSGGVAALATRIGREMGLSDEEIEGLRVCALLHDIGKASVPSSILNKPGRLSCYEWGLLQEHPRKAYESLRHIPFPWPVADVVCQHHERLDGSGYPSGLKGDEIHPWARILAVADVVDAMSKHRPYRPRLPLKEVLAEMRKGRGKLYDPAVVDAYIRLLQREGNRVMVVDDEPLMLDFLTEVLTLDGFDADGFSDPQEALEAFQQSPYPLVVTDLKMPGMSGFDLIKEIRLISPDTEVIVITGSGDKQGAVAALRLGARDFLEKPMDIKTLQMAVREALVHYHGKG